MVPFPPFSYFVQFIKEMCAIRNDPAFIYGKQTSIVKKASKDTTSRNSVQTRRTDVNENNKTNSKRCPYHKADHSIHDCNGFRSKTLTERKNFLKSRNICTRCCTYKHCTVNILCKTCGSRTHATALHMHGGEATRQTTESSISFSNPLSSTAEGSNTTTSNATDSVSASCTRFCGENYKGRSCSKTLLVDVYNSEFPDVTLRMYAILDDQSNRSLGSTELFDSLNITSEPTKYILTSCSGNATRYGRRAHGLVVRSVNGSVTYELPSLIECDDLPNELSEIPTPDVANLYNHLRGVSHLIPEFDPNCSVQLLIGRDLPEAHHVKGQIVGPKDTPYALELGLGWAIIGEVCLGKMHSRDSIRVNKVSVLGDGSVTCNYPCDNYLQIKEQISTSTSTLCDRDFRGDDIFTKHHKTTKLVYPLKIASS